MNVSILGINPSITLILVVVWTLKTFSSNSLASRALNLAHLLYSASKSSHVQNIPFQPLQTHFHFFRKLLSFYVESTLCDYSLHFNVLRVFYVKHFYLFGVKENKFATA